MRARRASANRVLTVLKAGLNHAHHAGRVANDDAWKLVKPYKLVGAPRVRHVDDGESARLLSACCGEFCYIVAAALLTGMRYGEIVGMRVSDFHEGPGTISLSTSKNGKPRLIHLTDEGIQFFTQAVAGKQLGDLVFRRGDGEPWGRSHQFRPLRDACKRANITPVIGFHILRHTYASRLVMRGVPLGVVAQQIGDSEAITAKHYAHLAPSYVGDMVRQALLPIGAMKDTNVMPLRATGSRHRVSL
jgi:integrase